ncbi:MAG: sulfatase-like hydrolase/transferase [Leptospiraceae bacterium]|nr:sulfatase-like hydrolase/transferase [Leptospiraceae bacterium]
MLRRILWKQRLIFFSAVLLELLLLRLFFAFYNIPSPAPGFRESFLAFLGGLRFDLATIPIFLAPGLLIGWAGMVLSAGWKSLKKEKGAGQIALWSFRLEICINLLLTAFLTGLALSSAYNFRFNGKHLGWEFSAYLVDLPMLARSSMDQSPMFALMLIALVVAMVLLGFYLPTRINIECSPLAETLHGIVWMLIFVVLSRGGFQASPIRTADALQSGQPYLDQMALNGVFTVSRDLSDTEQFRPTVPRDEAIRTAQQLLEAEPAFLSKDYPLVRYMPARNNQPGKFGTRPSSASRERAPPNIVILILESGSASLLQRNGGDPSNTPFLNALVGKSVYFDRFFSSGGRSANGIFAMFAGIPDRAGRTILRSSQIQNRFAGMAMLLKKNGYSTGFYHGGDASFDNLDRVLPELGFDTVVGQKRLRDLIQAPPTSTIGYDDAQTLNAFLKYLDERQGPFMAAFFSQSTHHPFTLPSEYEKGRPADAARLQGFFAAARFMDDSLAEFFSKVRNRPYFENTVFILVADHTHHAGLNYLQDRHIPLFIYAPALWKPEIRTDVASQLDLLPTILAISGGGQLYSSMGRDLSSDFTGNDGVPFAFFAGGSDTDIIGWIEGSRILFKHFYLEPGVLLPSESPAGTENLMEKEPDLYADYLTKARIFYQVARTLEKENSIWPDPVQLEKIYRSVKTR